ncbi:hypothetical protein MCAP1_000667 [Malassezia caprae]|uniref:Amino acid permease/ SLC12A domain-containing protein n=1 Tax=Malassezia caprae TaxID=1381934 RepID=A0AAF0E598_9BASI|nr:hypothetical protein MCAP1_000667 [Malassezia caprae]
MGFMILMVLFALGEIGSLYPVPGAFADYASRFIDPAVGFAVGYNYSMNWIITLPLEFTASAIVVGFWNTPETMPKGAIIAIYLVFIIFLNLFGARGYAEFEFFATNLKMLTLIGFILCGVIIDCGGVPGTSYMGASAWHHPGAFNNSFKGFCSVLTTAAFAFSGTEIVALAAAESSEPRKQLPRACKLVVYRVLIFYALALFIVTLLVPSDTPSLHGDNSYDPNTSPFVIAIQNAGIHVLPDILNAIIAISAISVANSSVYASSRMIHALAVQGKAPKIFKYVDRTGRPLMAVLFALLFGLLGFLIYVKNEAEVFSWLLSISGLSVVFTWTATCLGHIRFRAAWAKQGRTVDELPWASPLGVYGSYIGFVFNILVIMAQFYVSAFPIGEGSMTSNDRVYNFFLGMLSLPIFITLLFGYKFIKRTKFVRLEDIDLVSVLEWESFQFRIVVIVSISSLDVYDDGLGGGTEWDDYDAIDSNLTWLDSFKRAETGIGKEPAFGGDPSETGGEKKQPLGKDEFANTTVAVKTEDGGIIAVPEETSLKRSLKGRHIQFIALGGSIGTGLFVGSGSNLSTGGPGSIIVAYLIVAVMIIPVIFALGELAAVLPVTGAFSTYATRFIDPSWGFAMGWNYFLQWLVSFPLEATAATILITFWDQDEKVPKAVWIIVFWLIIAFINLFGARGYGEFEFVATAIKVLGIVGFIICAIVIDCGGSPSGTYLGARGWHTTDAFLYGFKGFCSVFITAAFAFSGTELVGLAAAETANPRKEIPKACKQVLFRVLLFYILSLFLITLIVPADDPRLQGSSNDARASPFVIAIQIGQINALPQIFNAVILLSALSVGNASVYGGSRTLLSLAEQGMAPKIFRYVDRAGRPLPAVLLCLAFGFLGFLIYGSNSNTVFNWLLSISGLSARDSGLMNTSCELQKHVAYV